MTSRTIRGTAGIVWLVVTAVIAALLLLDVFLRAGLVDGVLIAPWLLLTVWVVWAFFVVPHVRADTHGVRVVNPFRVASAPWRAVADITLQWQIAVRFTDGRAVQAWGVTAKRPNRRVRDQPAERELEILREFAQKNEARAGDVSVRFGPNVPVIAAFVGLALWAAVAVAVTH